MTATAITILEWTYEPKFFFEEPFELTFSGGEIAISAGIARGEFDSLHYDEGKVFQYSTQEFLRSAFLAQQVQVHQPFTISQTAMAREHSDGRRDASIFVDSAVMTVSVGTVDLVHRDGDGNVLADTKAERLQRHANFRRDITNLVPQDIALKRMLQSFSNALSDRDNLLIHLYEIRETLSSKFSDERVACATVRVSSGDWSKFGRLANKEPLLEGRHRGKHLGLRKATTDEANWALNFGQSLIEGYVQSRELGK